MLLLLSPMAKVKEHPQMAPLKRRSTGSVALSSKVRTSWSRLEKQTMPVG